MSAAAPPRRLHIDRLELDLRGIDPATAEAAVRVLAPALGPELARALAQRVAPLAPAVRIDAGRMASPASPSVDALAAGMAQRIAGSLGGSSE